MLDYIIIKKGPKFEFRLYTEINENIEGQIIYKGHRLNLDGQLLSNILEYKMEKTTNKVYLKDYCSDDRWFIGTKYDASRVINQSYESLQQIAEQQFGKFRKIVITRC